VRVVNRGRRRSRRNKSITNLSTFLELKAVFHEERSNVIQRKYDEQMECISKDQNTWKIARPIFHSYSPHFRGLDVSFGKINNSETTDDILANHYKKHFVEPKHDEKNFVHQKCISIYE
jgi:hypothetical protein